MTDATLLEQIVSHIANHIMDIGYGVLRIAEGDATEKLYQLIKARIGRDEDGRRLLQRFEQYPQSSENAAALTTKLDELARVDPQFASNLEEHARRLGISVHQGDASGTTIVSAQARRGAYAAGRDIKNVGNRRTRISLTGLAIALALLGTGVTSYLLLTDHGHKPAPGPDPAPTSGTSGPDGSGSDSMTGLRNSIIAVGCTGQGFTLEAISADSAKLLRSYSVQLPDNAKPTYDCSYSSYALRQVFNSDYSRVAVNISDTTDGSSHAGYYDIAAQRLVNLDPSSSQSFSAVPQDSAAIFSPSSGDVWFYSQNTQHIMSAPVSGGQVTDTGQTYGYLGDSSFILASSADVAIVPGESNGPFLPSPDGRVTAVYDNVGGPGAASVLELKTNPYADPYLIQLDTSFKGRFANLRAPLAWVDDHRFIAYVDTSSVANPQASGLALVSFSNDYTAVRSFFPITPQSDRANGSPVPSPDGKSVAFLSFRGEEEDIFMSSLTPNSTPQHIALVSGLGALLGWQ
jgi:hypothetical protein